MALTTAIPIAGAESAEQPTVLVSESFGTQTQPANFGFPSGATVTGGVLNLTVGMANYTTSVKQFAAPLLRERTVDLSFDWKTSVANNTHKTGTELRDSKGNLVFAIAATAAELRYSLTGPASDSTSAPDSLNPTWTRIAFNRAKWYTVDLHIDFAVKTVQYTITTKESAPTVMASGTGRTTATDLAKWVACDYFGTGVQSVDNFSLARPGRTADGLLAGRKMYAFGDSIVYGHSYPRGFADFTAERELMNLTKYARNGATIGPARASGGQVIAQVRAASAQSPDFVVFDGGTNDAEVIHDQGLYPIGAMAPGFDPAGFNAGTYAGSLELTLHTMHQKWPAARIVYVAVHKLGSRDWGTQLALRTVTLQICAKWGVAVADVFADAALDTRVDAQRVAYTFSGLVNGYPGTGGTGTHPNIAAITKFYAPVLTAALARPAPANRR
ncbi:MAG: SGNH/GDSL hydrolase family protein [Umezawaea sp.]